MRALLVVGCGGFGRETVSIIDAINAKRPTWAVRGFLDDAPSPADVDRVERLGLSVLGGTASAGDHGDASYVVGIGDGAIRERLAARLDAAGLLPAVLVHPSASLGRDVQLGPGTILAAGSQVTTNVRLGRHVHVDRGAQVGHDSHLDDFSTLHPGATLSGSCVVGARARLGTTATVLPGVTIGADAVVGAAACVVSDVAARTVVKGVPAR